MIKIGDVRIRVSNIKNYGIRKEVVFFEKVYGRNRKERVVEKSGSLGRALGEGLIKTMEFIADLDPEFRGKEKHDYHDYDYEYFHTEELVSVSDERASAVRDEVARSIYVYLKKGESYVLPGSGPPLNERGEESSSLAYHAIQEGNYSGKKIMYADEDGVYQA